VLAGNGEVEVTSAPEITAQGVTTDDMIELVTGVAFPLPPGGDSSAQSWPHHLTTPVASGMEGKVVYDGTASFAGDTTWNGIPARVIVSEGSWKLTGTGMPEGAPAEVELVLEGTSTTSYLWDPARGVLLAMDATSEGDGDVSTMGFTMPMVTTSVGTAELVE
jgi:hypothetical protein